MVLLHFISVHVVLLDAYKNKLKLVFLPSSNICNAMSGSAFIRNRVHAHAWPFLIYDKHFSNFIRSIFKKNISVHFDSDTVVSLNFNKLCVICHAQLVENPCITKMRGYFFWKHKLLKTGLGLKNKQTRHSLNDSK